MSFLFANEWLIIPAISFCIFIIFYLWSDRIIEFLKEKSLGKKDDIIRMLDLMFVEINQRQITYAMLGISFGLGFVVFFLLLPNVIGGIILGSAVTIAGWNIPSLVVKSLFERRAEKLVDQMVDGLTIMANGIKAGLTVPQSMERVVDNLGNPISQEFALVLSQLRIGRTLEEALIEFGERVPGPDVQMFVTGVNILKETGGNLAETFETIVLTIRERQKIEKKIQAMTAQGIMQGIIVTLVPFLLIGLFMVVDPSYMKPMFGTTLGLILLTLMLALQIIGGLVIRKIVKIKV